MPKPIKGERTPIRFYEDLRIRRPIGAENNQWIGISNNEKTVVPSEELTTIINRRNLEGLLLPVILESCGNNGGTYYTAHPVGGFRIQPYETFKWDNAPTALMIDCQNLIGGLRSWHGSDNIPLVETVRKIHESIKMCEIAKLFCCTRIGRDGFYREEIRELYNWGKIHIINREPKFIRDEQGFFKKDTDVDALMLPAIPYLMWARPHIESMVIVSGDSDCSEAMKMWTGIEQYRGTGQRALRIVSTPSNMSKELWALTNNPKIEIVNPCHL